MVDIIFTDKTGTLTENHMSCESIFIANKELNEKAVETIYK